MVTIFYLSPPREVKPGQMGTGPNRARFNLGFGRHINVLKRRRWKKTVRQYDRVQIKCQISILVKLNPLSRLRTRLGSQEPRIQKDGTAVKEQGRDKAIWPRTPIVSRAVFLSDTDHMTLGYRG